jgi:hypothetical protein
MRKRIQFRINIQFIAALLKLINVSWRLGGGKEPPQPPTATAAAVTPETRAGPGAGHHAKGRSVERE